MLLSIRSAVLLFCVLRLVLRASRLALFAFEYPFSCSAVGVLRLFFCVPRLALFVLVFVQLFCFCRFCVCLFCVSRLALFAFEYPFNCSAFGVLRLFLRSTFDLLRFVFALRHKTGICPDSTC